MPEAMLRKNISPDLRNIRSKIERQENVAVKLLARVNRALRGRRGKT
jgi:sensor domain CHASE-containing protein